MPLAFKAVAPQARRAKVLLLGEAGVGKTHAALTFPKPAVIDAEGSIDWFADRFKFIAVPTKSYADVRDLVGNVRSGSVQCETLVIDSLTSIYNGLVNAATQERQKQGSDDLRPLDWGRIKRKFSSLLDELYHKLPVNVVCVGWIKPEYAKPGDRVNGKTVSPNDLVKIGETFDGDRKTLFAFDFAFKILDNDGKRTRAQVIKSRSGKLTQGQVIESFSWETLRALLPAGASDYKGMSDEEQETRDEGVLEAPVPRAGRQAAASASVPLEDPDALLEPASAEYAYLMEQIEALGNAAAAGVIEKATNGRASHPSAVPKSLARAVARALLAAVKAKNEVAAPAAEGGFLASTGEATAATPSLHSDDRDTAHRALMAFCSSEKVSDDTRHRITQAQYGAESSKHLDATSLRELRDLCARWVVDKRPQGQAFEAWLEKLELE